VSGGLKSYLVRVFRATEYENRRAILAALPRREGASLLDLGAGDGEFTAALAERIRPGRTAAVEFMPGPAEAARSRGIEVHEADLERPLPFDDGEFELVHSNQVIEHLRATDLFVSEIRRVLRPGGLACISTNNLSSWHNVFSLMLGLQPMPMHVSDELIVGNPLNPEQGQPHAHPGRVHLRLFTGRALRELCEHHGLVAEQVRSAGYYPLPPRAARIACRVDPLHGAFLVGLFRRSLQEAR
jgi:SAM-dependent methyltransferase